jgi:hypothetical protein
MRQASLDGARERFIHFFVVWRSAGWIACLRRAIIASMRALFSDIDGVLHPPSAIQGLSMATLALGRADTFARLGLFCWAGILEDLLVQTDDDLGLIIHSTWRQQSWVSPQLMRAALGPLGHRFIGMTSPDLQRQASIEDLCQRAGISDRLILDDAGDEFAPGTPGLLVTNPLRGVSDPAIQDRLIEWSHRGATQARHCIDSVY